MLCDYSERKSELIVQHRSGLVLTFILIKIYLIGQFKKDNSRKEFAPKFFPLKASLFLEGSIKLSAFVKMKENSRRCTPNLKIHWKYLQKVKRQYFLVISMDMMISVFHLNLLITALQF